MIKIYCSNYRKIYVTRINILCIEFKIRTELPHPPFSSYMCWGQHCDYFLKHLHGSIIYLIRPYHTAVPYIHVLFQPIFATIFKI